MEEEEDRGARAPSPSERSPLSSGDAGEDGGGHVGELGGGMSLSSHWALSLPLHAHRSTDRGWRRQLNIFGTGGRAWAAGWRRQPTAPSGAPSWCSSSSPRSAASSSSFVLNDAWGQSPPAGSTGGGSSAGGGIIGGGSHDARRPRRPQVAAVARPLRLVHGRWQPRWQAAPPPVSGSPISDRRAPFGRGPRPLPLFQLAARSARPAEQRCAFAAPLSAPLAQPLTSRRALAWSARRRRAGLSACGAMLVPLELI